MSNIFKAQTFKKIKKTGTIKTPAEKILDFLMELKDIIIDTEL